MARLRQGSLFAGVNFLQARGRSPGMSSEGTERMSTPLKGILVGLGGRAHHWYNAVRSHPDTEYVAYVEPMDQNRVRAIERWGLPPDRVFRTLEDAAEKAPADFVMDVTPPGAHESVAQAAFKAR